MASNSSSIPRVAGGLMARLVMLLAFAALGGLVVAVAVLPFVGGLGYAAQRGLASWQSLPTDLKVLPLPQRSRILAADGSTIATFYYQNRVYTPLSQVAVPMQQALVAIEDSRFYQHHGIDFRGLIRAAVKDRHGGISQGGSTLTQQYVKNVLLQDATTPQARAAATADTLARKIREARYALALEKRWGKKRILEAYLNIAYFGDGAYGIGAAAQHYFGVPAIKLGLAQSALLAGLVQSPSAYDPVTDPALALQRRNIVLARMAQLHYIPDAFARQIETHPLNLHVTSPGGGCLTSPYPFFCDYVVSAVQRDPALGATVQARTDLLLRGGLTIRTSLVPSVQRAAQNAVDSHVPDTPPYRFAEAADVVQPGTGRVEAMAVDRRYGPGSKGYTELNYATGGTTGFQAGSTFKLFTLTAALEEGIPLATELHCPNPYVSHVFTNGPGKPYVAYNAEPGNGNYNIPLATAFSVNTCFIQIEERTGLTLPAHIAKSLGITDLGGVPIPPGGSFTLGTNQVSPLAMAAAYATYADHGRFCPPVAITSVVDDRGHSYGAQPGGCRQAVPRAVADTVTSVLQGVIDIPGGTGNGAAIGRPAAGKTGTAENESNAWFCGFVPQLAACVWMADPAGPLGDPLIGVRVKGVYYAQVFGGTIPAPTWGSLMSAALRGVPVVDFAPASPKVSAGKPVAVPYVIGEPPSVALAALARVGLHGQVAAGPPQPLGGTAGTVALSEPGAGSLISVGSTVVLVLTNGTTPPPSPTATPSESPSHSPSPPPKPSGSPTVPPRTPSPKGSPGH